MRSVLLCIPALALLAPRTADACSPPMCWPGAVTPGQGATVPANLPAIYWHPGYQTQGGDSVPAMVTLDHGGTSIPFTATRQSDGDYLLVPSQPLVVGEHYQIVDHNACASPTVTFTAAADAPLPQHLGSVLADAQILNPALAVATGSGSCSIEISAVTADVHLDPAVDATPWLDVLHYETRVDGAIWRPSTGINVGLPPGASWVGRSLDRVYAACVPVTDVGASPGLTTGMHVVEIRATLPGTTTMLAAATAPVTLDCDPSTTGDDPASDGGCNAGRSSGALWLAALALWRRRRRR